jgi:RNA polymerase sigma-70 factor, ECF subfamily
MSNVEPMRHALSMRSNDLANQSSSAGFRRKTSMEEDPATARLVSLAVTRAKQGDQEAVRFLYMRYADNVYGYVRSIVRDHHEAEDVTQHVFAKLMTQLPKYQARDVPFAAWILRVARNVAVDHLRQRRAIPCEEVRALDPRRDDQGEAHQVSLSLREALGDLPEDQREVIVLRHLVGLSPGEIAGRMDRTEPSIHGLHHRGRGALRNRLKDRQCAPAVRTELAA